MRSATTRRASAARNRLKVRASQIVARLARIGSQLFPDNVPMKFSYVHAHPSFSMVLRLICGCNAEWSPLNREVKPSLFSHRYQNLHTMSSTFELSEAIRQKAAGASFDSFALQESPRARERSGVETISR